MIGLFLWTVITGHGSAVYYDWRMLSTHPSVQACEHTAQQLGGIRNRYRCIDLGATK